MELLDFYTKTQAIKLLGISPKKFESLNIKPTKVIQHSTYKNFIYLYDENMIDDLVDSDEVNALKPKVPPKPKVPKDYKAIFDKKYSTKKDLAILDACEGLFNLNRYCKHPQCNWINKNEIYELKNKFIEFLYKKGFCEMAYIHTLRLKEKECYSCHGTGYHYKGECYNCGGTGIYQESDTLRFIVFHFTIDNKKFCWHQPDYLVEFEFQITNKSEDINETEIKPLEIPRSKLKHYKELIKWVLEKQKTA